jgi:uncharacterized protein YbjT (DUF2867 family)
MEAVLNKPRTLVIGGTGRVGCYVCDNLRQRGHAVSVLTRGQAVAPGVTALRGTLTRVDDVVKALAVGFDRLVVITPDLRDQHVREDAIFRAAKAAGVGFVVKLSAQSAGLLPPVSFGRLHRKAEQALERTGLPHAIVRPVFFQESLLLFAADIRKERPMTLPVRDGRVAMVAAADAAAIVARLADDAEADGAIETPTGPEALTFGEAAERIGRAGGQPVRLRSIPAPLARLALPFVAGIPFWKAQLVVDLFAAIERGAQAVVTDCVPRLLGRPAQPVDLFIANNLQVFAVAAA